MKRLSFKINQFIFYFLLIFIAFSCKKNIVINQQNDNKNEKMQKTVALKSMIQAQFNADDFSSIDWEKTEVANVKDSQFNIIKIEFNKSGDKNVKEVAFISFMGENQFLKGQILKIKANSFDSLGQLNGTYYQANLDRSEEKNFEIISGIKVDNTNNSSATLHYPTIFISLASWYNLLDFLGVSGFYYGFGDPPPITGGGGGGSTAPPIYSYNSLQLTNMLQLSITERNWLNTHPTEAQEIMLNIYDAQNYDYGCDEDVVILPGATYIPIEAKHASKITIAAAMSWQINSPINETLYNSSVKPNLPSPLNLNNYNPMWAYQFSLLCATIKMENPTWSNLRVFWEASKEMIHLGLDLAGVVPVVGEIADLANGIIYTLEGDGVNATLSFASMIPIAGWASTGVKFAKRGLIALDGSKRILYLRKLANGVIDFGDRGLLRKVLGLASGDTRIAHHLVPWEHGIKPIVQKAAGGDFHLNEILNGIPLTSIQHSGSHFLYNQKIGLKLDNLWNANPSMSVVQAQSIIRNLANDIKNWITSHPNESINNIILP